jgi:hypothetical protein
MPIETITVTITGANPQTKTVQVNVDPTTGSGSTSVSYTGSNGGADTAKATATIAGNPYTSNSAFEAFQAANGPLAVIDPLTVTGYQNANDYTIDTPGSIIYGPANFNTVVMNQPFASGGFSHPISGVQTDDGNTGEYKHVPPLMDQTKPDGSALNSLGTPISAFHGQAYMAKWRGKFVVAQAGIQTFYFQVDDAWAMYFGPGCFRTQGTYNPGSLSSSFSEGGVTFTLAGSRNTAAGDHQAWDYIYMNFPAPGIYDFQIWFKNNNDNQQYMVCAYTPGSGSIPGGYVGGQYFGGVIKPIPQQAAPSPTVPAGNVALALANGGVHVAGQAATLTVQVSGIVYSTKPYIPVYEGVPNGKIFLYNDTLGPDTFGFQSYNSQPVDKTAAASQVFNLSGSNSSWQGRLSILYNDGGDGKFSLKYSGAAFDSHVDLTTLTIQSDDIAWFNSVSKTFDLFSPSGGAGGAAVQIEVDYMVKPTVASVSPSSVVADGGNKVFTITLDKPFSPQQQGANNTGNVINTPTVTLSGATLVGSATPIKDGAGWITGYTATFTVPSSSSNSTATLAFGLTGTLTYLSGTGFTTGGVTYISGYTTSIQFTGSGFVAPTISSFSVAPKSGTAPSYTITSGVSETLTVIVSSPFNNAMSVTFYRQQHGTSNRVAIGTSTSPTATSSSGGLFYKTFVFAQVDTSWYATNDLGVQATDTVSGLSSSVFFDSSTYTLVSGGGGGGGGGGCPAIDMYVGESLQVAECRLGDPVSCLSALPEYYLAGVELRKIEAYSLSTQICYRFVAENGAEVVVSDSTPVPTREAMAALQEGHPVEELPIYANAIRAGMHVVTDVGNGPEWSLLTETTCVGLQIVAQLSCGGRNFAAGAKPGKYIFTHNAGQIVK